MYTHSTHHIAVVLCAGQGTRMGAAGNKVFLPVQGKPLVVHALETFERTPEISEVLLVAHKLELEHFELAIVKPYKLGKISAIIAGGQSRHQSEMAALHHLRARIQADEVGVILIHDGARPFITGDDTRRLITSAMQHGGALLATAVRADEHIIVVDERDRMVQSLTSTELWRAQTPQAFASQELLAAYDAATIDGFEGTDTASSFERAGKSVYIVAGQKSNFKVTMPEDLLRAEYYARS